MTVSDRRLDISEWFKFVVRRCSGSPGPTRIVLHRHKGDVDQQPRRCIRGGCTPTPPEHTSHSFASSESPHGLRVSTLLEPGPLHTLPTGTSRICTRRHRRLCEESPIVGVSVHILFAGKDRSRAWGIHGVLGGSVPYMEFESKGAQRS